MSKEIKIGLIGAGWMGKAHTTAFHNARMIFGDDMPVFELVSDVSEDAVAKFAKNMGYNRYTTNWMDVVTDPEIDLVDVATPNCMHYEMAKAALEHGKHVFCEKPLADTVEKCKEAEAIIAAHPELTFMLGFMRRYDHSYQVAKKKMENGDIGDVIWSLLLAGPDFHHRGHPGVRSALRRSVHRYVHSRLRPDSLADRLRSQGAVGYRRLLRVQAVQGLGRRRQRFRPDEDGKRRMAFFFAGRAAAHGSHVETEIVGTAAPCVSHPFRPTLS